jgi:hypothetical protein
MIGTFLRRLLRDRSGAVAAELVLLAPLAVFMLLVTIEAGYFMVTEQAVLKSVRNASRYGARQPFAAFNCTGVTGWTALPNDASTLGTIRTNIANVARFGELGNTGTLTVPGWEDAEVAVHYSCVTNTTGIYLDQGYAPRLIVIGTPNYPTLFHGMAAFPSSMKLFAREQAAVAGI